MNVIELCDVTVAYGSTRALRNIDLRIEAATAVGIIGANGSGKSTLLKTIAGLIRPARGRVRICGSGNARKRPAIAYVPQIEAVDWSFPATVRDVVAMGRFAHVPFYRGLGRGDHRMIDAAIAKLSLVDVAGRHISALSGGQQQRVFLARALVAQADIFLLDEPTTGVDAATEEILQRTVRELVAEGKTLVMTTHDLDSIEAWFDRVVVVDTVVVADGTAHEVAALDVPLMCEHGHGHAKLGKHA